MYFYVGQWIRWELGSTPVALSSRCGPTVALPHTNTIKCQTHSACLYPSTVSIFLFLSLCSKSVRTHLIAECCSFLFASCLMLNFLLSFCAYTRVILHTHLILLYMRMCLSIHSYSQYLIFTSRCDLQKALGEA